MAKGEIARFEQLMTCLFIVHDEFILLELYILYILRNIFFNIWKMESIFENNMSKGNTTGTHFEQFLHFL